MPGTKLYVENDLFFFPENGSRVLKITEHVNSKSEGMGVYVCVVGGAQTPRGHWMSNF